MTISRFLLHSASVGLLVCLFLTGSRGDAPHVHLNEALRNACFQGRMDDARRLIEKGADVNAGSRYGETPLIIATREDHTDVARLLLTRGANPNAYDRYRESPLINAMLHEDIKLVQALLKAGANPNSIGRGGHSVLWNTHYILGEAARQIRSLLMAAGARYGLLEAARLNDLSAVREKLAQGQDPNLRDREDATPLMYAVEERYLIEGEETSLLTLLLDHSANPNAVDNQGRTALMRTAASGSYNIDSINILLDRGAEIDLRDKEGTTALLFAAKSRSNYLLTRLLDRGADINARDREGRTALMRAMDRVFGLAFTGGQYVDPTVKLLLERGVEVNARDHNSETALHIAARHFMGDDSLPELLAAGAQVNVKDNRGVTPLMWAARYHRANAMKLLRAAGAQTGLLEALLLGERDHAKDLIESDTEINAKGPHGWTPLMIAAQTGDREVAERLLAKGAKIKVRDEYGLTALHYAVGADGLGIGYRSPYFGILKTTTQDWPEIVSLLLRHGAQIDASSKKRERPLMWAAHWGYVQAVRRLIAGGAALNTRAGTEALLEIAHWEAGHKGQEMIQTRFLMEQGADHQANRQDWNTLLGYAFVAGDRETAQRLLGAGADVNAKGKDGSRWLNRAVWEGDISLLEFLLANGAKVDARGDGGETALMHAASSGNVAIVRRLLVAHANVHLTDFEDYSALDYAKGQNRTEVIQILKQAGAKE